MQALNPVRRAMRLIVYPSVADDCRPAGLKRFRLMRIKLTSVLVNDQERALSFYTEVQGFVLKRDLPAGEFRFITLTAPDDPDGPELLLEPNDNPAAKTFQAAIYEQGIPLTAFQSDDVQADYERLQARGVTFTGPPTASGSVTLAIFDDTCGNLIQLYQE
jgi:predicted enzyme related to lactoylglutathione lyase